MELGETDRIKELSDKYLGEKMKMKAPKDPLKPKRNKSGFMYYCDKHRPALIDKQREGGGKVKIGDIAKELGASWQKLTIKKRKVYMDSANKDKERYEKEIGEYNEKNGF